MADTKISGLTALTAVAAGDLLEILDISDATMGAAPPGTNKKITRANLLNIGSDVQAWDADLDALAALGNGIAARTGAGAYSNRTLTGTTNRITVTNGDGVSGNPTFDVGSTVYTSGGTDVAVADGGTGASTAAAARLNLGQTFIPKTADETVNNSTTLQNDDDLFFAVAANEVWSWEAVLFCGSASTASDLKLTFTAPTSPTSSAFFKRGQDAGGVAVGSTPTTATAPAATISVGSGSSILNIYLVELVGWIINGSNAGNIQLQWAQDTLTASNTKVFKGSYLVARKHA